MIPMWLALIMILGGVVGIFLLILLICYGYVGILMIKDRRKRK